MTINSRGGEKSIFLPINQIKLIFILNTQFQKIYCTGSRNIVHNYINHLYMNSFKFLFKKQFIQ